MDTLLPTILLKNVDLPTFDLPNKANSFKAVLGHNFKLGELIKNFAFYPLIKTIRKFFRFHQRQLFLPRALWAAPA